MHAWRMRAHWLSRITCVKAGRRLKTGSRSMPVGVAAMPLAMNWKQGVNSIAVPKSPFTKRQGQCSECLARIVAGGRAESVAGEGPAFGQPLG